MGLFKRNDKSTVPDELLQKFSTMKKRQASYVPVKFEPLCVDVDRDENALLTLSPISYYAAKTGYIKAVIYSNDDNSENYVILKETILKNEKEVYKQESKPFLVSKDIIIKMLSKVGVSV